MENRQVCMRLLDFLKKSRLTLGLSHLLAIVDGLHITELFVIPHSIVLDYIIYFSYQQPI
jgi:hypothetical protein